MPKVSVIVPVYKAEAFIEACARSLFGQTLEDMEYIFVDDCSPDRSIEILKTVLREYPSRENQVRIIALEKNLGVAKAREIGLSVITGEYFIYCDSDDYVDLNAYATMYQTAQNDGADVVVCDVQFESEVKQMIHCGIRSTQKHYFISDILSYKVPGALWNKLFSKKLSQDLLFSRYGFGEDLVMTVQMAYCAGTISYLPYAYYHYIENSESITHAFSVESRVDKFVAMRYNIQLLSGYFYDCGCKEYSVALYHCKYYAKNKLIYKDISSSFKVWWIWLLSFPRLTFHLNDLSISKKERLFFYLSYVGITPYSTTYKLLSRILLIIMRLKGCCLSGHKK